jgi:hypothetical protein
VTDKEQEYQYFLRREAKQRPLRARDLGWTDEFGNRWSRLSDIFTRPELQSPVPPTKPIKRKRIA